MRIWRTEVAPEHVAAYQQFAHERSLPMFQDQSGCLGALFTSTAQGRYAVATFWQDPADVQRLDTSPSYRETSAASSATGYLRGEQTVELFAVEGGGVWSSLG
jgi:heme-degrading monooxygenase HmoA